MEKTNDMIECDVCGQPIEPGQLTTSGGGGHWTCPDPPTPLQRLERWLRADEARRELSGMYREDDQFWALLKYRKRESDPLIHKYGKGPTLDAALTAALDAAGAK